MPIPVTPVLHEHGEPKDSSSSAAVFSMLEITYVIPLNLFVFRLTRGLLSHSLQVGPSRPLPLVSLKAGPGSGRPVWAGTVHAAGSPHPQLQLFPFTPRGIQLPSFVVA